ncbi:hypothetical protein OUZ56_031214 [Daphnia magna]|uniref:Uncharacterized protein n=1 Tax=Daphnia magna TaxID=35525 RepID=A0ABQ9ZTL8_9CRUS|nr:hypothetical protein OUZ56_031214 [Daphnia magna]
MATRRKEKFQQEFVALICILFASFIARYWTETIAKTTFDLLRIRLAKSRAASRLVRTVAEDSRNMLQTWLD